jgi:hypothetical protein
MLFLPQERSVADSLPAETLIPAPDPVERRRSTRLLVEVPITVMGMDTLGEPFKESVVTATISCYGCKYRTRRYAPMDSIVTLEIKPLNAPDSSRIEHGRVVWVQRPRHHRETFQIGVALERPGNVWGIDAPPADWFPPPGDALKSRALEDSHVSEPPKETVPPPGPAREAEPPASPGEWETLQLPGSLPASVSSLPANGAAHGNGTGMASDLVPDATKATADAAIAGEIALLRQQFTGKLESALLETLKTFSELAAEIVKETREACRASTKDMESELHRVAREARIAGEKSVAGDEASARKIGSAKQRRKGP